MMVMKIMIKISVKDKNDNRDNNNNIGSSVNKVIPPNTRLMMSIKTVTMTVVTALPKQYL